MDHWQTPVYSIQTYLHLLRRAAKPLRYYLIRICHGLFSHYTIPTVVENLLVGDAGFEPATLWSQTRCATRLRQSPLLLI